MAAGYCKAGDEPVGLVNYYDRAALTYERDIEPAFRSLADELVEFAAIDKGGLILDLGTGTGLVGRAAYEHSRTVVGADFSRKMLRAASARGAVRFVQTDMHRLCFADNTFDFVLASFALNGSNPEISLGEARRVITPQGRFIFQEWGTIDSLSDAVSDILAQYAVDAPKPDLETLRGELELPVGWDELESPEALSQLLEEVGFAVWRFETVSARVQFSSVEQFVRYKYAWPHRRAELEAMPDEIRRLCWDETREALLQHTNNDGTLTWSPEVLRVDARRLVPGKP